MRPLFFASSQNVQLLLNILYALAITYSVSVLHSSVLSGAIYPNSLTVVCAEVMHVEVEG